MNQRNHRLSTAVRLLLDYMLEHREQLETFAQGGATQQEDNAWLNLAGEPQKEGRRAAPLPSPAGSD